MSQGDAVRLARLRARLSQGELASRVGVSVHTVSDVEHGRIRLAAETYRRWLEAVKDKE